MSYHYFLSKIQNTNCACYSLIKNAPEKNEEEFILSKNIKKNNHWKIHTIHSLMEESTDAK